MRKVPVDKLVTAASNTTSPPFIPVQDNQTIFADYASRYKAGQFAQKPAINSFCSNDGVAILPFPADTNNVNTTAEAAALQLAFLCPSEQSSSLRSAFNPHVYRYESAANFTNVSPQPWLGAYHSSDLAYIFGTHQEFRGHSTGYEYETSHKFQDLLLAFIKDPENVEGWPTYSSGQLLRIGAQGGPVSQVVPNSEFSGPCQ